MKDTDTQTVLALGTPVMYKRQPGLVIAIHRDPLSYDVLISGRTERKVPAESLLTQ